MKPRNTLPQLKSSLELPNPTAPLQHMLKLVQPREAAANARAWSLSAKLYQFTKLVAVKPWPKLAARNPAPAVSLARSPAASTEEAAASTSSIANLTQSAYSVCWARNADELRAAQALRWQVFAVEMGARLQSPIKGLDIDAFDPFCEHLLVKDAAGNVVGTYRALLPEKAELACGWYSSTEFHLKPLLPHAERVMEVGRSCVHPDHRNGTVMMMLWQELARFMDRQGLDWLFGCVSVPMREDGGHMAANLWRHFIDKQVIDTEVFCKPRHALDVEAMNVSLDSAQLVMPPLLKGYLRLGAKIASAPALDEAFGCADFLIVLRKEDITPRYAKHFFGQLTAARD